MDFLKLQIKPKAAIYARVSSNEQAKDGYGLEDQIEKCKAAIIMKDLVLYKIYVNEKGISGTTEVDQRKELKELFDDAKKGYFSFVIFRSLDRIGRETRIILNILKDFQDLGIAYFSCLEQLDSSTVIGRMMINQIASFAQFDKEMNRERMGYGLKIVLEKYGERGGPLPYGYKRSTLKKGKYIEINFDEANIVKIVFEERIKQKSYERIAQYLNKEGYKPRKAKKWTGICISKIISHREKYLGGLRNGKNTEGITWPIILEKDPFKIEEEQTI
jgi:site-specific DNA recombinase